MTSIISQDTQIEPLLIILTSAARVAVLRVFMLDPMREYYQRQIEAATGLPIRAVQRELDKLTAVSLLYRRSEGNRTYYQVDTQFSLFPELRSMVLKTASPEERLRGLLAVDESVRLAILDEAEKRVLVVSTSDECLRSAASVPFVIDVMSPEDFLHVLSDKPKPLDRFLTNGVDLLGRREDLLWRRIEAAGYSVRKGKGVP